MRKQTKIAAVVSAAALLALGASITSFAAAKGTWMMVDGEWYCYDKNGEVYENKFCVSGGKDFYVGDDGALVRSSWVEYDGDYYFVNSSGEKITNDWRLTTPYDDDSAEDEWFYFDSNGKRVTNKRIKYKGNHYFFNSDGKMLRDCWVTYDPDQNQSVDEANDFMPGITYYTDETGACLKSTWIKSVSPETQDDDVDAEESWYYLKSDGKATSNKKEINISGQTYFFDEDGIMLSGWVAKATDSNGYKKIDEDVPYDIREFEEVYYCGDEDDGHAKKNRWVKAYKPSETLEDNEDNTKYWYWFKKDGKLYIPVETPSKSNASGQKYSLKEGQLKKSGSVFEFQKYLVNSKEYCFNEDGEMINGFVRIVGKTNSDFKYSDTMYYFGGSNDGSMKTGSISVKDDVDDTYKFYFYTKANSDAGIARGAGITGNQGNKLYNYGMLIRAKEEKYEIYKVNDCAYIVNQNGSIQHSDVVYKDSGVDVIDAKGWAFDQTAGLTKYSIISGVDLDTVTKADDIMFVSGK